MEEQNLGCLSEPSTSLPDDVPGDEAKTLSLALSDSDPDPDESILEYELAGIFDTQDLVVCHFRF